ncbi:unnamed protein product [Echinostoma caproni]|uniref:Uncharacterized protein n=1 Tax=Echinostoma caproni TaxID=27848 RepID=A0A183ARY6_9TREM|nr:unnamed protein product [Echinostoma caproni]
MHFTSITRSTLQLLERENTELHECLTEDAERLRKLMTAHEGLCDLFRDTDVALTNALELFNSKSILNFTERRERQDHLVAIFFVILNTSDQVCGRINPQSLGAPSLGRATGFSYTTRQKADHNSPGKLKYDTHLPSDDSILLDENTFSMPRTDSDVHMVISPEKLFQFGLVEVEDKQMPKYPATFLHDLSLTAKGLNRHVSTETAMCSVAVQTNQRSGKTVHIGNELQRHWSIGSVCRAKLDQVAMSGLASSVNFVRPDRIRGERGQYTVGTGINRQRTVVFDSMPSIALPSLQSLASI